MEGIAAELGSARAALSLLSLRLAEAARLLPQGTCSRIAGGGDTRDAAAEMAARSEGALPPWAPPARVRGRLARALLAGPAPEPRWFALCAAAEELFASRLGAQGRRAAGLYYTPPEIAEEVVALALRHGSSRSPRTVLDPCAGAGSFLCAAARALPAAQLDGADLHVDAMRAAGAALALCGARPATLVRADSLRANLPAAELLVSNPPYGHVTAAAERRSLARKFPALRGGEIDRYAAFLLRSLDLVEPGGMAALIIPDTWMTNSRSAVCDLGKPFAAAKDTRVHAVVLVRRSAARTTVRPTRVLRGPERLADAAELELRQSAGRGWQIYRSDAERRLCTAMEQNGVPLRDLCQVAYGLRTGDNARFVARRPARPGELALVGGEDVVPFALRLRTKALRAPTAALRASAERQLGRERLCIQRIRTNSRAPHARWLEAAPVPPELVCLDSLSTLTCDDGDRLWALLAVVCSVALQRYHRLRTTDVNVKPAVLRELPVPRALLDAERAVHLAALARQRAAEACLPGTRDVAPALERAIDAAVYGLFELSEAEVVEAERGFWGPRFAEEFPRLAQERQTARVA
jgi:hypothetical protein